VKIPRRALGKV